MGREKEKEEMRHNEAWGETKSGEEDSLYDHMHPRGLSRVLND